MGLRLCWLAVPADEGAGLLQRLRLEVAGDTNEETGPAYCCAQTPEGWVVLTLGYDTLELEQARLAAASDVLVFEMNDTVMFSQARAFREGRPVWSVTHDPDKDNRGISVEGSPPQELAEIERKARAEQTAYEGDDVDYIYDVPIDLSRALCGYRPEVGLGLEWGILQSVPRPRTGGPNRKASLLKGMKSELIPLLRSLGWDVKGDRPDFGRPGDIRRGLDGEEQRIWFEYGQGQETYITVFFALVDQSTPERWLSLVGHVHGPTSRVPWWKRFSWKRFVALATAPPAPSDVSSVLEDARRDILIADAYLRTGELNNRLTVEDRRSWPSFQNPAGGPT